MSMRFHAATALRKMNAVKNAKAERYGNRAVVLARIDGRKAKGINKELL